MPQLTLNINTDVLKELIFQLPPEDFEKIAFEIRERFEMVKLAQSNEEIIYDDEIKENKYFLSEKERDYLDYLVKEVQEFSKEEVTIDAQKALRELCEGIFESEENLASNHDFFLYGALKRK